MAQKKSFLLRLPPELLEELQKWAQDDLRSLNAQLEYLLRESIRQRCRRDRAADDDGEGAAKRG